MISLHKAFLAYREAKKNSKDVNVIKYRLSGAMDANELIAALTEAKKFNELIDEKKLDILKQVNTAASIFNKSTDEFKVPDYIRKMIHLPTSDCVDNAIDMHLKIVDILKELRKMYTYDCNECEDLINVLKKAVVDT